LGQPALPYVVRPPVQFAAVLPRPPQHVNSAAHSVVSSSHGQPCSRAHFNTSRCLSRAAHVRKSHGQWCSHAHRNTSSQVPASATDEYLGADSRASAPTALRPGTRTVRLSSVPYHAGASVSFVRDVRRSSYGCARTHASVSLRVVPRLKFTLHLTPRAAVLPRPPQHLQVPAPGGVCASPQVPRAFEHPRPPQLLQMPALSGSHQVRATHGQPLALAHVSRETDVKNSVIQSPPTHSSPTTPVSSPRAGGRRPLPLPGTRPPPARGWCGRWGPSAAAPSAQRGQGTSRAGRAAASKCCCRRRRRRQPPWPSATGGSGGGGRGAACAAEEDSYSRHGAHCSCVRRSGEASACVRSGGRASLPPVLGPREHFIDMRGVFHFKTFV